MLSEFWLEGCCAGSIEFLLPLDSTPAYFTHLAAFAAAGVRPAELAEPPATAAVTTTSASGSRTFSGFFMRQPFPRGVSPGRVGRALTERSCSAPVVRRMSGSCRGLEELDRVAVRVA